MADNTIETDILLTGKDNGATAAIDGVSSALKNLQKGAAVLAVNTSATQKLADTLQKAKSSAEEAGESLTEILDAEPVTQVT